MSPERQRTHEAQLEHDQLVNAMYATGRYDAYREMLATHGSDEKIVELAAEARRRALVHISEEALDSDDRDLPPQLAAIIAEGTLRDAHVPVPKLTGCARCGLGHFELVFAPLTREVRRDNETIATHVCPCPTNGEPILMIVLPKPKEASNGE